MNIPFVVQAKAEVGGSTGTEFISEVKSTFKSGGLRQVVREIGGSTFTVFVDDFHYIPKDVQKELGQQIKEAAENGVRIVIASVPHRADDVVRSNTELRGRVTAIDTDYWKDDELAQIAYQGFQELNMDIAPPIMQRLTTEFIRFSTTHAGHRLKFLLRERSKGNSSYATANSKWTSLRYKMSLSERQLRRIFPR